MTSDSCGVTVPDSGEYISLLPLAHLGDITVTTPTYSFDLSICQNLRGSMCDGSGACQTNPNNTDFYKSLGKANSNVTYEDGVLKMQYVGGDVCSSTKAGRMTEILFKCDPNAGVGAPVFVSEIKTCVYQFLWRSSAVCEASRPIECVAYDKVTKHTYDLSSLSNDKHNYVATGAEFDITCIGIELIFIAAAAIRSA